MKFQSLYFFITTLNTSRTIPCGLVRSHYEICKMRNFSFYNFSVLEWKIKIQSNSMFSLMRYPNKSINSSYLLVKHLATSRTSPHCLMRSHYEICKMRNFSFYNFSVLDWKIKIQSNSMFSLMRYPNKSINSSYLLVKHLATSRTSPHCLVRSHYEICKMRNFSFYNFSVLDWKIKIQSNSMFSLMRYPNKSINSSYSLVKYLATSRTSPCGLMRSHYEICKMRNFSFYNITALEIKKDVKSHSKFSLSRNSNAEAELVRGNFQGAEAHAFTSGGLAPLNFCNAFAFKNAVTLLPMFCFARLG